jgi:putative phosphoesterase
VLGTLLTPAIRGRRTSAGPVPALGRRYGRRMRVAALYDIHGNLPALESALAEVAAASVDAILIGGDVAEGPQPAETLELLESLDIPLRWVRGNCDREPSEWVIARLDARRVAWLTTLAPTVRVDVHGLGPVLFCHGSPRSDEDIVTAVSDPGRVAPMLDGVDEAIVVSGHTHVQFDRSVAGHRLINAGSVGMPYQGVAGRTFWTIFGPGVEPRSSAFDAHRFASTLRSTGYPHAEWFEVETAAIAAQEYEQMAREQAAGT